MRESSGVADGLTSVPKGAGIAPLGDRFQPDFLRGTGSYAVPIRLPRGVATQQPQLSLTYSTGAGNGPFGQGWRLDAMRIERRVDRGVPRYDDTDEFVIGGAEVLLPVGGGRYRTQTETRFWMIERQGDGWRIRTGDGRTLLFGQTPASREGPAGQTFAWALEEERDPAGNAIRFGYRRDGERLYLAEISWAVFRLAIDHAPRPDVIRNGRAGFLRETRLRAERLALHCDRLAPTEMRRYELTYSQAANGLSLLERIELSADDGAGGRIAQPALTFTYSDARFDRWQVHTPEADIPPPALSDTTAQIVDMTANGLPDVLQSLNGRMYVWENDGAGRFRGPRALAAVPSTLALSRGNVAFADLNGNGRVDLFAVDQPMNLAFQADGRGGFESDPVVFHDAPTVGLADGNSRLMDVDGDGVTDLIASGRDNLLLYRHAPGRGFEPPLAVPRNRDLSVFPDLDLDREGTRIADMTGDGLRDMVLIHSGEVAYWPYLGHGRWGARVEMGAPPRLPAGYRDEHLYMLDVDSDGVTDLVYVDADRILIWLNLAGNRFSAPIEVPIAPVTGSRRIHAGDWFGDGRLSLAWDAPSPSGAAGYRVLRFDEGRAPYLMTRVENGLGGAFAMDYATTATMRRLDEAEGLDWPDTLPLTVPVVSRITQDDQVAGNGHVMAIRYHRGVYDGPNREFRGFRAVTVETTGDDSIPDTRQEMTFFQGDPEHPDLVERVRQRALAGSSETSATFERAGDGWRRIQSSQQIWAARLEADLGPRSIYFPNVTEIETREHSPTGAPDRIDRTVLSDYDAHGNPGRRQRESLAEGAPPADVIRTEEIFTYTDDEAHWLVKLPVRMELRDGSGALFAARVMTYDGPDFVGLPEGQASRGLHTRTLELKLRTALLPADYTQGRDLTQLGYAAFGAGDAAGFWASAQSLARDTDGNVVAQRDPMGNTLTIAYDADGVFPISSTDAIGRVTLLEFDPRSGEPRQMTMPDGRVLRYAYDGLGRLQAQFESDAAGVLQLTKAWAIETAAAPAFVTSFAPNAAGRHLAEFGPGVDAASLDGVSVSRQFYDGFGGEAMQVFRAPDGPGGERRFSARAQPMRNPRGLNRALVPARFTSDLGFQAPPQPLPPGTSRTRYDGLGQVVATQGPGPALQRAVRDTFQIDHFEGPGALPLDGAPAGPRIRREHFDARARLIRIEEEKGDGSQSVTSYDLAIDGRIERITDALGSVALRYSFAGPAPAFRIAQREAGTRTYYRNAADQIVEQINADGSRLLHDYDALQRLVRVRRLPAAGGAEEVVREIIYDSDPDQADAGRFLDGRVALARDGGVETRYSYAPSGQSLREETTAGGETLAIVREYDLQGHLSAVTYPDGTRVPVALDGSGAVIGVPGLASKVDYNAEGTVTGYLLGNGVRIAAQHEPDSRRLSQLSARLGAAVIRQLDYGYDTTGNVTALTDARPGDRIHQVFSYDGLHRLSRFEVRANDAGGALLSSGNYRYDDAGNLTDLPETASRRLTYGDAARPGLLTSFTDGGGAPQPIGYDARGHMASGGGLAQMEFDAFDRLIRAVRDDGTVIAYAYDHRGRRVLRTVTPVGGGAAQVVRYAAGLYERHGDHTLRHLYLGKTLLATEHVAQGQPDRRAYFFADHHGSVMTSMDAAGAAIEQQRYTPFGLPQTPGAALDRYLGRERDPETGLTQLGMRMYHPGLGRFVSPDWYVFENPDKPARTPQGYCAYGYALNNPLVFKDPSGLWFGLDDLIVAAVGFVVGFVSGLIYGLANGQGWGSLLTALETGLTTAAGAWLGWTVGGPIGAIMGGMNGLISGVHGIYDWTSAEGWFAFLSDSTWGLIGTSLGNVVHVINLFYGDANYREDLSRRQNRHVYEGGFALKESFAFTQGNVISNAGQGRGAAGINASFIANHEELHIWQARIFGPLFQATYIVWAVGGFIVGSVVWFFNTDEDWGSLVETAAYYDNPFEYWAYSNDNNWPPSGANPLLTY
ncbi:toxin TcdB middle/N-terminal domain-containing protein [Primorskyibacter sp. 2E233]|uniref:toxin TcdB middle/N-terminal domain-containing protein n=1 Tax=Primorskyibacter sp. 2E233 TaxID=3413431 RepID=UPI003BF14D28